MAPYTGFPRRRGLSVSVGAVLMALASQAAAVGLGQLQSHSYLGEPLDAAAPLLDVRPGLAPADLRVRVLNAAEAAEMGVEQSYMPPGLQARLDTAATPWRVQVTTSRAVKEPYLVLVLEVSWAKGRVYREYALLLDIPGRVLPPLSASAATVSDAGERSDARPARATLPPPPSLIPGETYQVARGDSLWQIAERLRGVVTGASNIELQAWLLANNDAAFIDRDVNRLRAGASLRLPTGAANSAPAERAAAALAGSAASAAPSGASLPTAAPATAPVAEAPVAPPAADVGADLSDVERGLLLVGAADRDDKTRELIDLLVRENEALKQRMVELEDSDYLNTLQDLVLLQRDQIIQLRKQLNLPEETGPHAADLVLARLAAGERGQLANRTQMAQAGTGSADRGSPEQALLEAAPLAEAVPAGDPLEPEGRSQVWMYAALALLGAGLAGAAIWLLARRREPAGEDGEMFLESPVAAPPPPPVGSGPDEPTFSAAAPANRAADQWLREQVSVKPEPHDGGLAMSAEELAEIETGLSPIKGRPTDVVKRDIARKTEDYRAGRHRRAQSLGGLELTEMVDLGETAETDPAKGIHRAMMLCDFKQFDQARTLLSKLPLARDSRELAEALAEVEARERAHWNAPS